MSKLSTGCTIRQDIESCCLYITHMLYVSQVCHGVSHCVKDGSCSSSSLEWKSMDSIHGISYYLNKCRRYQTHHRWQFFFQEDSALVHCACKKHSPIAAALSSNTPFEWKMWFSCFPVFPGSAETQVIWGGILKHLLIAYSIGNISAKNIKIRSCVSKL